MKRFVPTPDGAELCVETFGDEGAPPLLLIGGITWAMDNWHDAFCERLAAAGLHVIRYDHRDTGESTSWPAREPGYTSAELAADPTAVLDGLGIRRAHVLGLSMGGGIAQDLGLTQRERVLSLTLVATSFARDTPDGLPPPDAALAAEPPEPEDWTDTDAVIDYYVASERLYAGPGTFDEPRSRAVIERVVARTRDIEAASKNHDIAIQSGGSRPGHLTDLAGLPVLVVHGTRDLLFPIEHGRALAAAIPGARYLELEGMGHQLPPREHWDRLVDALMEVVSEA
jgi:pimeloyl-ACP methyl ester carboxylesterase